MAFHLDEIPSSNKKEDGDYTIITSGDDLGSIYLTQENKKVVSGLPPSTEVQLKDIEELPQGFITPCVEGTVVKCWFTKNEEGEFIPMFSGSKRVYYEESFWGNKDKKFGKLFLENGGSHFIQSLSDDEKREGFSYYFIIMDRSLVITSRIPMLDNETIIFFIGIVDIDGNITMPEQFDTEVFYQHNDRASIIPSSEIRAGRILVPMVLTTEEAFSVLTSGYDTSEYTQEKIPYSYHRGESVIVRNGNNITKITPPCQEIRKVICGESPNIKFVFYSLMEMATNTERYKETFHTIGRLTEKELLEIYSSDKSDASEMICTYITAKDTYLDNSEIRDRRENILAHCVLFCPLHKINDYIDAHVSYHGCREIILRFMKIHNSKIRKGGYDEELSQYHSSALMRMRDMSIRANDFAQIKRTGEGYKEKMESRLRFFLQNERSKSLYRIEKAIKFIQSGNSE